MTASLSPVESAYVAGLIDGEGCIYAGKTAKGLLVQLQIISTSRGFLEAFRLLVGGGIVRACSKPLRPRHRQRWVWSTALTETKRVLTQCLSYLVIKREQAELVLALTKENASATLTRMRQLNKRGPTLDSVALPVPVPDKSLKIQPTDIEAAYLCAIIDGEGSFSLRRTKSRMTKRNIWQKESVSCAVRVSNTARSLMQFLAKFGYGTVSITPRPHKDAETQKPVYEWAIGKKDTLQLWPSMRYLILKAERASVFENYLKTASNACIDVLQLKNMRGVTP